MKKTLFNILKFVLITIACLLLGFSVYNCNSSRTTGDKLPMPFGIGMAVVISGSMEPTISIDDMILVKKADEYKLDDVGDRLIERIKDSEIVVGYISYTPVFIVDLLEEE